MKTAARLICLTGPRSSDTLPWSRSPRRQGKSSVVDPDSVEVSDGFQHENLEGWIPALATEAEIFDAFEKAFDYRGDIVITRKDGRKIEGYIFDRKAGKSLADSLVRLYPVSANEKLSIRYAEIARLEFCKDRAAG